MYHSFLKIIVYPAEYITHTYISYMYEWNEFDNLSSEISPYILIIIDHEAREIMRLVASVCLSVRLSVRFFALSRLNGLTYDLHLLHGGWP